MHRFFIDYKLTVGAIEVENAELAHQITRVLRIHSDETVGFFNGDGYEYAAHIEAVEGNRIRIRITEAQWNNRELPASLTVCLAFVRKERMEWAFEKCTETGVAAFQPIITERSIEKNLNPSRGQAIVKEAAEQSGRAFLPRIIEPIALEDALKQCKTKGALGLFFDTTSERSIPFSELSVLIRPYRNRALYLFIGPEGGFTPRETLLAKGEGMRVLRMYPTILRSETAAVVFSAVIATMCITP